jgi:glycosyltransferase involved in cell wall biosynthesis
MTKAFDIISFHPGKQHNFEQAVEIFKHFKNYKHITSLYFSNEIVRKWNIIHPKIGTSLKRRSSSLTSDVVSTNPFYELRFLIKRKFGGALVNEDFIKRNRAFQSWVLRKYAPPKICIGYDTSSWLIFEKWKNKSFLILDLSIAVPQYKLLLAKAYHLNEELIAKQTVHDSELYDIYQKELALADMILCGSDFVKNSCISLGVEESKLVVLPYGADLSRFSNDKPQAKASGKIKIVFVGTINYRKGANIVFEAWSKLSKEFPNAELHLYGNLEMPSPKNLDRIIFHGFINQASLIEELKTAHVSILPTFFEGSSLAIYQSMAMGLAVITTNNAGSIIEDKKNGILINYNSVEELITNLRLLIQDESFRKSLAANAQRDIRKYTWLEYGEKLHEILLPILKSRDAQITNIS